ncbi:hypothetical protein ACHAW6_013075 [Cyclotella cf. meneghiniana]
MLSSTHNLCVFGSSPKDPAMLLMPQQAHARAFIHIQSLYLPQFTKRPSNAHARAFIHTQSLHLRQFTKRPSDVVDDLPRAHQNDGNKHLLMLRRFTKRPSQCYVLSIEGLQRLPIHGGWAVITHLIHHSYMERFYRGDWVKISLSPLFLPSLSTIRIFSNLPPACLAYRSNLEWFYRNIIP